MRFRKLRIAWSVAWGILCLLLIALWVRSYWWCDIAEVAFNKSSVFSVMSKSGDFRCSKYSTSKAEWRMRSIDMGVIQSRLGWNPTGFYWRGDLVQVPYWFLLWWQHSPQFPGFRGASASALC
jgi:hypothetical protein